ncbi:MAG: sigma 54-interacting transcriptional regulator [Candidatus Hodarchaeota archaeon]
MDKNYQKSESLFELAVVLGQQNEFKEILRIVSTRASMLLEADVASIMMINPHTQDTIKTIYKDGQETSFKQYRIVQTNVIGLMLDEKQPFFSANIQKDTRFRKNLFKEVSVKSVMCVPLWSENIIFGCLLVLNKNREFDKTELVLLEKSAAISAPFLRNVQKIHEYFSAQLPEDSLRSKYEPLGLLGKSERFIELLQAIEAAARCDVRVLLEGQSGTGKELIAAAIHKLSSRSSHPFVAIDCGALPDNLVESELFGYEKGAFTGATRDRVGLIAEANNGTLFMDEITNLPFDMQAKLLRVLQEGEVRAIGSNASRKVDVRIIAAASDSLRKQVEKNQFREDLFYRLFVYPIYVPTLNERTDDILLLANHFLEKFARQQQKQAESFDGPILNFFRQRKWAGNIRELENFVERLVTLAAPEMTVLNSDILPAEYQKEFKKLRLYPVISPPKRSLQENLTMYESQLIQQALMENDWNQRKTARVLKISEGTLRYKMEKLRIDKPR